MDIEKQITITDWKDMPVEQKLDVALEQPDITVEEFVGIARQTINETAIHDPKATALNEAMFGWMDAQLERFSLSAQPAADLQVAYSDQVYTQKLLFSSLIERLHELKAIDPDRYSEWNAKLPILPEQI